MITDISTSTSDLSKITLKLLLYGSPGSGKSWFSQTMPAPYTVGFEDGLLYWKMRNIKADGVLVETYEDLVQVLDEIKSGKRAQEHKSIVFDGLHHLTHAIELMLLKQKNKTKTTELNQGDWGVAKDYVRIIMRKLVTDLGKYYHICVLGDAVVESLGDNSVYGLPDTIGKLRGSVGGFFDLYLYTEQTKVFDRNIPGHKGENKYLMHSVRHRDFGGKDRTGTLFDGPIENDFNIIFKRFVDVVREHHGDNAISDNPYLLGEDVSKISETFDSGPNPVPTISI